MKVKLTVGFMKGGEIGSQMCAFSILYGCLWLILVTKHIPLFFLHTPRHGLKITVACAFTEMVTVSWKHL